MTDRYGSVLDRRHYERIFPETSVFEIGKELIRGIPREELDRASRDLYREIRGIKKDKD